jgi:hypothetical protein
MALDVRKGFAFPTLELKVAYMTRAIECGGAAS